MKPITPPVLLSVCFGLVTEAGMAGSAYHQEAYLKASNSAIEDAFGCSVALSSRTVVIGAHGEDGGGRSINADQYNNLAASSGAAYVFTRRGNGWIQEAYVKSSNSDPGDMFGSGLAIAEAFVVVSAPGEDGGTRALKGDLTDNSSERAGAVYIFTHEKGNWRQQYLKASNPDAYDEFGRSVAMHGDLIAVGAPGEDSATVIVNGEQHDESAWKNGAVYLIRRNAGHEWRHEAYLKPAYLSYSNQFGSSVAVSGDTVVCGAPGDDSSSRSVDEWNAGNDASDAGAVYVFAKRQDQWTMEAYLKAFNADPEDRFGFTVAVDGDTIAVGAPTEDSRAVGVNGDATDNSVSDSGAVYVFVREGTTWRQQAYVKSSNGGRSDQFGGSIALCGSTMVVGAATESSDATTVDGDQFNNRAARAGAAYVFRRSGEVWTQIAYLKSSNSGADDFFGSSVALSGSTVLVGAWGEASGADGVNGDGSNNDEPSAGAAYVFQIPAETVEPISSIFRTVDGLRVMVPSAFGRRVGLEYTPALKPGTWQDLGNFYPAGETGFLEYFDSDAVRLARPAGFYRAFLRP